MGKSLLVENGYGQLGLGDTNNRNEFTKVNGDFY
jgi:hypothetical protein